MAAIRWLRGHADELSLASDYVGAGWWSAGACTTVFLASQLEGDFKDQMTNATDPAFSSLVPCVDVSRVILSSLAI